MSERNRILKEYFEDLRQENEWSNRFNASIGEHILNYEGNKAYEKWAIRNKIKIHIYKEETQMQKLWKSAIGKIHGTFHRIGAWCSSTGIISRRK